VKVKALVVAEEKQVIKDIAFCLAVRYPEIIIVSSSRWQEGIDLIKPELPDLIIVSSSLPGINATDLVSKIRQFSDVPLLVLIDGESDIDRAIVLEAGADDYIPRPLSPIELVARVTALLRRTHGPGFKHDHSLCVGRLTINISTREVSISGRQIRLTPHEYNLLLELAQNEGRVLPNSLLLEKVWGPEYTADYTFIKKYIYRLRCKLEPDPENPKMFLSEWGVGYRFVRPAA